MFQFKNHDDFVEVKLDSQVTEDLPNQGDGQMSIAVSSAGFSGDNSVWVSATVLQSFCRAMIGLERDRRGEATLTSMSPKELNLKIWCADSLGHMAMEGVIGHNLLRRNSRVWHAVHFGFEFDPSQLVKAASVGWVRQNGAGPIAISYRPFDDLIACLRRDGLAKEADLLDVLLYKTAWTTGSELLGELGLVVKKIRLEHADLTESCKDHVQRSMRMVKRVWPDFPE